MDLKLNSKPDIHENLSANATIPCSDVMKKSLDSLKRAHGAKVVNEKIRELLQSLIDQNKDKLEKAS